MNLNGSLNPPLVVDLDGTLIKTDLLVETASQYLLSQPFKAYKLLIWLAHGKSSLKSHLSESIKIDIASLPYNKELLTWLKEEKVLGRRIVLATASHRLFAEQVATHLGLFDEVFATNSVTNLKATAKSAALVANFGEKGFDYIGNDWSDLTVWQSANLAHIVTSSDNLINAVHQKCNLGRVFSDSKPSQSHSLLQAMRPYQWVKNLLVFVPLLAAHKYGDARLDQLSLMAFVIFSLVASSVYLLNDLVDVQVDRQHKQKQNRPFASGALSLIEGWTLWPVLLVLATILSIFFMPIFFTLSLGFYFTLTVVYSLKLKQMAVVDVLALAALYTLRIIAGAAAINVVVSFWLLLFSMFIFFSLALIKRYSEIKATLDADKSGVVPGRGYGHNDLELITSLGTSSGLISVLVLAFYIQDGQAANLYRTPQLIWLASPAMLLWISRAWLIAHRGRMHDDPIVFAIKDKFSWAIGLFLLTVFTLARVL